MSNNPYQGQQARNPYWQPANIQQSVGPQQGVRVSNNPRYPQANQSTTTTTTHTQTTYSVRGHSGQHAQQPSHTPLHSQPPTPQQHAGFGYQQGQQQNAAGSYQGAQTPVPQPLRPAIDYESLKVAAPPATGHATPSNVQVTSTTTGQTLVYEGSNGGGQSRKDAERRGQVQQFETEVQEMIASMAVCPSDYQWYKFEGGYLCAGGNHVILFDEIDKWSKNKRYRPEVRVANTMIDPQATFSRSHGSQMFYGVHPPNVDHHQPMHRRHSKFINQMIRLGYGPVYRSKKGYGDCDCFSKRGIPSCAELAGLPDDLYEELMKRDSVRAPGMGYRGGRGHHY